MNSEQKFKFALTSFQEGRSGEAIKICRDLIEIQPDYVDVLHLLAILHYDLQEYGIAENYCQQALKSSPDNYHIYFLLGNIFLETGKNEDALTNFQKAADIDPSSADAHYNLAIIYERMRQNEDALNAYKKVLSLNPNAVDVNNNIGDLLLKMKKFDQAIQHLRNALRLNPTYVLALNNLGLALKAKGLFDEAINSINRAVELNPNLPDSYYNLALILREKGHTDKAIENLRKAIDINPSFADAYYALALILKDKSYPDEAIENLRKAININPSFADAYCNLAIIFEENGRFDEALSHYQKALEIKPDDAEVHWNMSLTFLALGNFTKGWREYEWRFFVEEFLQRIFTIPQWDGSSLKGKTLLIYAEQGIGEEIMFASCLPEVIAQSGQCIIECDKRLIPIFARSFPNIRLAGDLNTGDTNPTALPLADMRIAIGTLPKFLRPNLSSFPQQEAYLVPDPLKVAVWRKQLSHIGTGLKVGISWRGGGKTSEKHLRSTVLSQWKELFSIPGIHFINLQYGDCRDELREARETLEITIHDWEDANPLKDLDNFASQIAALDLVISVDNATVHMAGALGVPVWILLPFVCDWRWMRDIENTPWYKSVRLIRQKSQGDWDDVFKRAASDLSHYLATGTLPEITNSYKSTISTESINKPSSHLFLHSTERTYRCAIITPVGPGHESLYVLCRDSVHRAYTNKKGRFSDIEIIPMHDHLGTLGRSKARNLGVEKASEQGIEWIFFIDADDLMSPSAFEYVSPYIDDYDGIWGSIWPIEKGEATPKERPHQLPFLYSIDDVLACDPFVTLGIGHFVKTSAALSTPFDESLDAGEDFDYYLRIWEKYHCIKIPLPFWYHRRGHHSHGPRSATGNAWRRQVEKIVRIKRSSYCRDNT